MKTPSRILLAVLLFASGSAGAAEPESPSAKDLASKMSALQLDGNSVVRAKLDAEAALQLQLKQRRTAGSTEVVYQILWPKERAGEAVLLRKSGGSMSGTLFTPPDNIRPIDAAGMRDALFGSDLSYADVLENFFAWENQTIAGTETIDRVSCQILESKPGKGDRSAYAMVRTWVDTRRMVPMRVEKYSSSGQLVRKIDTTSVANDDQNHPIPASLSVRGPKGSVTTLDGSRIRHDVTFSDREFTADGLKELKPPTSATR